MSFTYIIYIENDSSCEGKEEKEKFLRIGNGGKEKSRVQADSIEKNVVVERNDQHLTWI